MFEFHRNDTKEFLNDMQKFSTKRQTDIISLRIHFISSICISSIHLFIINLFLNMCFQILIILCNMVLLCWVQLDILGALSKENRESRDDTAYRAAIEAKAQLSISGTPDEIMAALERLYGRFYAFIQEQIQDHRRPSDTELPSEDLCAWAVLGLGTVANIGRELGLLSDRARSRLLSEVGRYLLGAREA